MKRMLALFSNERTIRRLFDGEWESTMELVFIEMTSTYFLDEETGIKRTPSLSEHRVEITKDSALEIIRTIAKFAGAELRDEPVPKAAEVPPKDAGGES